MRLTHPYTHNSVKWHTYKLMAGLRHWVDYSSVAIHPGQTPYYRTTRWEYIRAHERENATISDI
ncbi:hypothetical protein WN55_06344 [Dufourea novaeangliae]|uniref:Uncharacterized protein n=1 Tax=Dufourea novaeangliae TaxID=178035 RepID=A0A154PQF4_DUFNO|nr:hypothetical protein WN55_06344 [Dufourea novaeangliae]